jgi:hypothetical protein
MIDGSRLGLDLDTQAEKVTSNAVLDGDFESGAAQRRDKPAPKDEITFGGGTRA